MEARGSVLIIQQKKAWLSLDAKSIWSHRVSQFLASLYCEAAGGYCSVPTGPPTLYGTAYGLLTRHYLGEHIGISDQTRRFLLDYQDPETGWFIGPELTGWTPAEGAKHDREHLLLHLACTILPVLHQFGIRPLFPLRFAHRFCELAYLGDWLSRRDMSDAWLEGNNLLFVGQLLVYLRDVEHFPGAAAALEQWFRWLDDSVDPATGLWGTAGQCSAFAAMCGGYHQLLVYYHQRRPVQYANRLIDTVLELQHADGGFSPAGGGGACEDVDAVDILVNVYKLLDYRRPAVRVALRRVLKLILGLQNRDGGFPYKRGVEQSHMGIEATRAGPNVSTMFATWFRVHTIALIAEVLTDEPRACEIPLNFSASLSMGWHRPWCRREHELGMIAQLEELPIKIQKAIARLRAKSSNVCRRFSASHWASAKFH